MASLIGKGEGGKAIFRRKCKKRSAVILFRAVGGGDVDLYINIILIN